MSTKPDFRTDTPQEDERSVAQCHSDLARTNRELSHLVRQIEIAKKEWEKTMDCAGDMIILTDSDGRIKRVNRAVKDFAGTSYEQILGRTWEDLIIENELEATSLFAGSTELRHVPTGRWFELNAYPFDDDEIGFSGNVLIVHETTEVKQITDALRQSKKKIESQRNELQQVLEKINDLMESVITNKDRDLRVDNPSLTKCYVAMNCSKQECPCFGKEAMRCWQVVGTYCNGEIEGEFARKYRNCSECKVYRDAILDPLYEIGEHFNNMMHILGSNAAIKS